MRLIIDTARGSSVIGSRRMAAAVASAALIMAGCGSDDAQAAGTIDPDQPTIVVTTNILGDVVDELVGDQANVVTIMPVGADPHDFQASAQEVDQVLTADALITNGASFEEGLLDVIDSAGDEGVPTLEVIENVSTIEFGEGGHDHDDEHSDEEHSDDEHSDEEHSDDEHSDEEEHSDDEHAHDDVDPHFFTDPDRMSDAVEGISTFLGENVTGLDQGMIDEATETYLAELEALDGEVEELIAAIPEDQRVLITNHEVFGYFAERYDLELVGAVIPGGSTGDGVSAGELAELAEIIEAEGVPAIFADTSSSDDLVKTLADEVGEIEVVELYSESLGDPDSDGATYLEMVKANAERISSALS